MTMKQYLPKYTTKAQKMTHGEYQARNGQDVLAWMDPDEAGYLVEITLPSGVSTVWHWKKYFETFYQEATPSAIDNKEHNNENVD